MKYDPNLREEELKNKGLLTIFQIWILQES